MRSWSKEHADGTARVRWGTPSPTSRFTRADRDLNPHRHGTGAGRSSVDLIISNCVVNLSPDKRRCCARRTASGADGGEFYFSDVYCDRPASRRSAVARDSARRVPRRCHVHRGLQATVAPTGFADPRVLEGTQDRGEDEALAELLGEAKFYSLTYRLFKFPGSGVWRRCARTTQQFAVYKGTIEGHPLRVLAGRPSPAGAGEAGIVRAATPRPCWERRRRALCRPRRPLDAPRDPPGQPLCSSDALRAHGGVRAADEDSRELWTRFPRWAKFHARMRARTEK